MTVAGDWEAERISGTAKVSGKSLVGMLYTLLSQQRSTFAHSDLAATEIGLLPQILHTSFISQFERQRYDGCSGVEAELSVVEGEVVKVFLW